MDRNELTWEPAQATMNCGWRMYKSLNFIRMFVVDFELLLNLVNTLNNTCCLRVLSTLLALTQKWRLDLSSINERIHLRKNERMDIRNVGNLFLVRS